MFLAAIEHHARRVCAVIAQALTETRYGFYSYEAGDYLDHTEAFDPDWEPGHGCGNDVGEGAEQSLGANPETPPRDQGSADPRPSVKCTCWCPACSSGGHCTSKRCEQNLISAEEWKAAFEEPGVCFDCGRTGLHACPDPAAVVPPAAAASVPAGVSAAPNPAPPAGLTWTQWIQPAICDVLAGHNLYARGGYCDCGVGDDDLDFYDWREHVAPLIAERIDTVTRAIPAVDRAQALLDELAATPEGRNEMERRLADHRVIQRLEEAGYAHRGGIWKLKDLRYPD